MNALTVGWFGSQHPPARLDRHGSDAASPPMRAHRVSSASTAPHRRSRAHPASRGVRCARHARVRYGQRVDVSYLVRAAGRTARIPMLMAVGEKVAQATTDQRRVALGLVLQDACKRTRRAQRETRSNAYLAIETASEAARTHSSHLRAQGRCARSLYLTATVQAPHAQNV